MTYKPLTQKEKLSILGPMIRSLGWSADQVEAMFAFAMREVPAIPPVKGTPTSAKDVPDFMKGSGSQGLAERMREDPQFFINAAMYAGNSKSGSISSERVLMLEEALKLKNITALGEWKAEMEMYPNTPMGRDELSRGSNCDMPFRAFYLLEAVLKLLEITHAPETMNSDLRLFMQSYLPHTAKKRANIQKALIEHPNWSDTKIATTYKYDLTGMRNEIKNGQLRRCPVIADKPDKA